MSLLHSLDLHPNNFTSALYQKYPNPLDGVQPAVKAALTKAYKQGSSSRVIRAADLITLPGIKKAPKKRIAAMLEPVDGGLTEENGEALEQSEEENSSDTEEISKYSRWIVCYRD